MSTVTKPDDFDQFATLATQLYNQPGCGVGGPLHVQLEDHNTQFLVGESGARVAAEIAAALAMVEAGSIPTQPMQFDGGWPEGTAEHNMAHYYGTHPETIRIAAAILAITTQWSEDQAAAAYAAWANQFRGGACTCVTYPVFGEAAA